MALSDRDYELGVESVQCAIDGTAEEASVASEFCLLTIQGDKVDQWNS